MESGDEAGSPFNKWLTRQQKLGSLALVKPLLTFDDPVLTTAGSI
jgi:hypothetical protein